jgi:flagellar hook-length control protein FliK
MNIASSDAGLAARASAGASAGADAAPAAPVTPGSAAAAAGGEGANGGESFLALIDGLLQDAGSAAADPPSLTAEAPASDDTDDTGTEDLTDADGLFAALLLQGMPVAPPPPTAAAAGNAADALPGANAAPAGGKAPARLQATTDGATDPVDTAAPPLALETALDVGKGDTATSTPGSGAGSTVNSANAWALAAGRLNGSGDAAATRAPQASADPPLREPVGTSRWSEELGTRLTLMAAQGQQSGSLRLSPEHLGPLEVQITIADDRATVQFGAQHSDTRAALTEALPRLREMFASAGLQLGQADVSGQAPRQRAQAPTDTMRRDIGGGDGEPSPAIASVRSVTHRGLLDTYA